MPSAKGQGSRRTRPYCMRGQQLLAKGGIIPRFFFSQLFGLMAESFYYCRYNFGECVGILCIKWCLHPVCSLPLTRRLSSLRVIPGVCGVHLPKHTHTNKNLQHQLPGKFARSVLLLRLCLLIASEVWFAACNASKISRSCLANKTRMHNAASMTSINPSRRTRKTMTCIVPKNSPQHGKLKCHSNFLRLRVNFLTGASRREAKKENCSIFSRFSADSSDETDAGQFFMDALTRARQAD